MDIHIDHNMEGQAALLLSALVTDGWLDLEPLRMVTLVEAGLPVTSSDRIVWRFAQTQGMVLLTNNRNALGVDSLTQTMREEATTVSLPVLTIGNLERLAEREYRRRCAERLVEIVIDLGLYLGTGRLFIP